MAKHWFGLRFGSATVEQQGRQQFFQVQAFLNDLAPESVNVELYAEAQNGGDPVRETMNRDERLTGSSNGFLYTLWVPATPSARRTTTPRLVPQHNGALVPLEAPLILWHDSPSWR